MEYVKFERKNHIALVTLNRPEALNAINYDLLHSLGTIINCIRIDPDIRLVIITGAGEKSFSVGADLKERKKLPDTLVKRNLYKFGEVFNAIEQLPQPTICMMNGHAFGGGLELALACDFRIASDHLLLGLTETSLGIIPGAGGTQRLPRLIGETKALELILTAKRCSVEEALQYGIVSRVVPYGELETAVHEMADAILKNAPIAIQQAKFAVKHGMQGDLHTGLHIERKAYEVTLPTADRIEALQAFTEKRKPIFKGK
ncbi:MAG: enoyl-CoA hydratase-related protein [Lysinibacillus sp.]